MAKSSMPEIEVRSRSGREGNIGAGKWWCNSTINFIEVPAKSSFHDDFIVQPFDSELATSFCDLHALLIHLTLGHKVVPSI